MKTSYIAEPQDDGTIEVTARLDGRTVAVIHESAPDRWATEIIRSGHIPVDRHFELAATWQEAAQAVAAWGNNKVEIVVPEV
ncbi:hypothetical protein VH571_15655 [Frondihabitans sp. 4ASC-45]|uniref:hypothetical protein n=1 Tax=Frondihabitans sp. 4ASC-45 TaxID=3111636 RepID=UPI003C24B947